MVTSTRDWKYIVAHKSKSALLLALLSLLLLGLTAPFASAQTQTRDNPDDLVKALSSKRFYVADSVKTRKEFMDKNSNIERDLENTVNKLKGKQDVRIAVLSNSFPIPASGLEAYGNLLLDKFLTNPKPDAIVMVNAESQKFSVIAPKLSSSERNTIISETSGTFISKNVTEGTVLTAEKTVDKIEANERGGFITTLSLVILVSLAIAGGVAYLMISTKKKWQQQVSGLEHLTSQVSDQIVRVSDEVNFLTDAARAQTDVEFGAATRNFSEANSNLRELQKVSPVTLLLKGPDYQRKLNLTGGQLQQAQQSLSRVEQQVKSLPGI